MKKFLCLLLLAAFSSFALRDGVAAPVINATKDDNTAPGVRKLVGDQITYTISIGNTGDATATAVTLTDATPTNTSDVSLFTTPIARNDSYSTVGNIQISVPVGNGVLVNDNDPDDALNAGSVLSASAAATSTSGGNVVMNANGSFTYNPPVGFEGTDTFTYTLTDNDADTGGHTNTATVSITVTGMIWFINGAAAAGGDGRQTTPFNTIAAFQALNDGTGSHPAAGDNIFIFENAAAYTGPITLLNNQKLIGQDATADLATITSLPQPTFAATAYPVMNSANGTTTSITSAANAIQIANAASATIRGLNIANTTGSGIAMNSGATTFGTLTVSDFSDTGTGQALSLTSGTLSATYGTLSSSSSVNVISLTTVNGTLTVNSNLSAISGATGADILINGGTLGFTFPGTITNTAGRSIDIQNKTGGTVAFSGAISDTGAGIFLNANTGAIFNFTGGLSLSTGANAAFAATGGGTVNVTGATNTIATTTGTALNITTTIGASGVTFKSIAANGAVNGIILSNTGAGVFLVSGDGTQTSGLYNRNGSGGAIQSATQDAVLLTNASNVTLRQMNITNAGWDGVQSTGGSNIVLSAVDINHPGNANPAPDGSTGNPSGFGGGNGWYAENITGTNRFDNNSRVFNWQSSQSNAVLVHNTSTNFTSFTVDHALISTSATGAPGFHANLNGTTVGQVSLTNSEYTLIDQNAAQVLNNGSGAIRAIVQGNNFHDADATSGDGNNTLYLTNSANGAMNFTIGGAGALGNQFHNLARLTTLAGVIQVDAAGGSAGTPSGGTINGTIENNNIWNDVGFVNGRRGIDIQVEMDSHNLGTLAAAIKNNTMNNVGGNAIHISTVSVGGGSMTDGNWTITGNSLGAAGTNNGVRVGLDNTDSSSAIEFETNVDVIASSNAQIVNKLQVANNIGVNSANNATGGTLDITNIGSSGATGNATLHATITGNTFTNQDTAGTGHVLDVLNSSASSHETLNLNITGNNTTLGASAAGEIRLRQLAGTYNIQGGSGSVSANNSGDNVALTGAFGTVASVTLPTAPSFLIFAPTVSVPTMSVYASGASVEQALPASPSGAPSLHQAANSPTTNAPAMIENVPLTQAQVDALVAAAIMRWEAAGISPEQAEELRRLKFEVAQLSHLHLGEVEGSTIRVDQNAAGNGWFLNASRESDALFGKESSGNAAVGGIDLLTAIMHEMGHALGLEDTYSEPDRDNLMYGYLTKGERRLPAKDQAKGVVPNEKSGPHFLGAVLNIGDLPAGKTVTVTYKVTINSAATSISNQGTVKGSNIADKLTDDPQLGGASDITVTPVELPPVVSNVSKTVTEDVQTAFAAANFTPGSYSDPNSDALDIVRITSLPANGVLKNGATTITAGMLPLDIAIGSIANLTYTTNLDYNGSDSFGWNGRDGTLFANSPATVNITVTPVNDAPVLAGIEGSSLFYAENAPATAITATLGLTDVDSANMTGATVSITTNYVSGQDVLALPAQPGITSSFNGATGVLTLSGPNTVAIYRDALRAVTYQNTSENPSAAARVAVFQANDGGAANNLSNTVQRTITVTPANDAPTITGQFPVSTAFNTARTLTLSDLQVTDPDSTYPGSFTLTATAGANYSLAGNQVTPALNFFGTLTVPVKVNDNAAIGALDSNTFQLAMTVNPSASAVKSGGKIQPNGAGVYQISFIGNPGVQYTVQRVDVLPLSPAAPAWVFVSFQTADANGNFSITDTPPVGTTQRYYRAIIP